MRYLFCVLAISVSLFGSSLKYFAGVGINFGSPTLSIKDKSGNPAGPTMNSKSYVADFSGGVQQYWDREEYVGGRAMGEFGIGGTNIRGAVAGVFSLSGALDLLIDFLKQDFFNLGIFGGFEYGMTFLVSNSRVGGYAIRGDTYGAYWRVGASVVFEKIHRIDLTYKNAIAPLALPTEVIAGASRHQVYAGGQFCLGYKILF